MNSIHDEAGRLADQDLVARIRGGDGGAFELLMRRHNRMMFRAARSILGNDAEAEDAVQEAYVRAYRALDGFRGEAKLSTWLTRIAVNEALGRRRAGAREVVLAEVPVDAAHEAAPEWDRPPGESPEEATMRKELGEVLEASVDRLPQDYRTVFMLRVIEGLSERETAQALDIGTALVKVRLFRARALLRRMLEAEFQSSLGEVFAFDGARCDRIVAAVLRRLGLNGASGPDAH